MVQRFEQKQKTGIRRLRLELKKCRGDPQIAPDSFCLILEKKYDMLNLKIPLNLTKERERMKKFIAFVLALVCILGLVGCSNQPLEPINTIEGNLKTYCEMSDGTWQFEEQTYKYRLVISGRMPNAVVDSTFVYLSNLENITFRQAMLAAGFSSNMADYFDVTEAVLVEWF